MNATVLNLSRTQFAATTLFHMLFPLLTIGLSIFLVVFEILWLTRKDELHYYQARFWSKILLLTFGVGVATGIPLELQFGTNWARFSAATGDLFGNILAFETSMSFALEAAFLAIVMFGWNRVSKGMHLFSSIMVAFGASLSAFWILVANSWMQTPAGVHLEGGRIVIDDYLRAVFNPDAATAFSHMWVAAMETTLFFVGGICAWYLIRKKNREFFLGTFRVVLVAAFFVAPLQIYIGDASALKVFAIQPAKGAAMEAHWETNPPGTSASWSVIAIPDKKAEKNSFQIQVPYLLSLLATRKLEGQVVGLKEFPPSDWPTIMPPFYAFRLMVGLAFLMWFLVLWGALELVRGRLKPENAPRNTAFWTAWLVALPLGFISTDSGWLLREMGRQPWIVYGLIRTADGVSPLTVGANATTLGLFIGIYAVLMVVYIHFVRRIMRQGPDLTSPLPTYNRKSGQVVPEEGGE